MRNKLRCWIKKKKEKVESIIDDKCPPLLNFLIKSGVGQTSPERKKLKRSRTNGGSEKKEKSGGGRRKRNNVSDARNAIRDRRDAFEVKIQFETFVIPSTGNRAYVSFNPTGNPVSTESCDQPSPWKFSSLLRSALFTPLFVIYFYNFVFFLYQYFYTSLCIQINPLKCLFLTLENIYLPRSLMIFK